MTDIVSQLEAGGLVTAYPTRAVSITPSDATEFAVPYTIWVGGTGDVTVEPWRGGNTVTYPAMVPGSVVPVAVKRVLSTGTTATNMRGQY